jgi:hypothetical protein
VGVLLVVGGLVDVVGGVTVVGGGVTVVVGVGVVVITGAAEVGGDDTKQRKKISAIVR